MPQSLAKVIIHIVFSTKERRPFLRDLKLRAELHSYLGGILNHLDCQTIIVGGVEDHVHLLSVLARTRQVSEVVKEVKRGSSVWIKDHDLAMRDFSWQNGYGTFSVGFSQIPEVRHYIERQVEHHRKVTFQDEFRALLPDTKSPTTKGMYGTESVVARCNPFRVGASFSQRLPRVGPPPFPPVQPWAECSNPFGIGRPRFPPAILR